MMFNQRRLTSLCVSLTAVLFATVAVSGCNAKDFKLIDHVSFVPSDNLEIVKVSLVFKNSIQADLAGGFMIKDYGYLFLNPYTQAQPFEVGFQLNTKVFNEQDYIGIAPTDVLPNGLPMGLGYPLVELKGKKPVSSKFDIFGYVDVLHTSWLGTAAIFNFINDQYFPNDLSVSQVFLRDNQGRPGVLASVFGPSVSADGTVKRAGGIALFANVRQLIQHHAAGRDAQALTLYPEMMPIVTGERAPEYRHNYKKLRRLEQSLVNAFNSR